MKYLLFIFFLSCTAEVESDTYTPVVKTFKGFDLEFFNEVNQMRISRNLPPLKGEKLLIDGCVQHANYMYSLDSLNHQYFYSRYIYSRADRFGEVVSYGYYTSASQISAYENSIDHFNVLINPVYTHIGIANKGLYQCVNLGSYK